MHSLIRSKGFIWLSNSHMQIFYWALAGRHFELKQYATWPAQRVTCRLAAATSQRRSRSWCRGVALLTHAAQSAAPPAQRHQRSALLRWTDRRNARSGARGAEAAPLTCHWPIAPRETPALLRSHEAVLTGHRWGAVPREEWPTDEKEVRSPQPRGAACGVSRAAHSPCCRAGGGDPQGLRGRRDG